MLRVEPILGRTINEDDDRPNAPDVAVISHRLWQTRFGGDRNIVGRFIELNDTPTQVVGVMPPQFRFVYHDNDAWVALKLDRNAPWRERGGRFINVVARVKAGTGIETARADMDQVASRLASTYEFNRNRTARLVPLREELTGQVEDSLIVLYIAVGVLLAIACFNIANLLIARAASRRQEIAIRTSLGAARGAIVRQLLVESMLLALAGGALGIVLARWSLDALVAFAPPTAAWRAGGDDRCARVVVRGGIVGADRAGCRACAFGDRGSPFHCARRCTPATRASRIRRASARLLSSGKWP